MAAADYIANTRAWVNLPSIKVPFEMPSSYDMGGHQVLCPAYVHVGEIMMWAML